MKARYPELALVGWQHGYYPPETEGEIVGEIRRARPDLLFVGMGTPMKEFWLHRNQYEIGVPFAMGVGGSFDVLVGRVRRAPRWAQEAGLEWLWRLAQEPRRMWRRYLIGNPYFVWLVLRDAVRRMAVK